MGVDFSPDGRFIITAGLEGNVRIWQNADHQPVMPNAVLPHSDRVNSAGFAPDGHRILTACLDGTVRIWDLAGTTPQPAMVPGLLSQDRTRFLTISNNTLQIWQTISHRAVSPPIQPAYQVEEASLNVDGRFLLTLSAAPTPATESSILEVWEANAGRRIGSALLTNSCIGNIRVSRDGRRFLVFDGRLVESRDLSTGHRLAWRETTGGPMQFADFSPDGDSVVSWATNDLVAVIWDAVNGKELLSLTNDLPLHDAAFSVDGQKLVLCSAENGLSHCYAQVWNTATGKPIGAKLNHGDGVLCASFSRDGNHIVTGGEDFKAKVWDTATGRFLALVTHEDKVNGLSFSSDAVWFATASADKTAGVWTSETGDPLTPPLRHHTKLTDVKFLPDNRSLVISDREGLAWIWKLSSTDQSLPQIIMLAQLLAGKTTTPSGGLTPLDPESLYQNWNQIRALQPQALARCADAVTGWYEFQAEECERAEQWAAAVFQLEHLLKIRPGDASVANRLARAKAEQK